MSKFLNLLCASSCVLACSVARADVAEEPSTIHLESSDCTHTAARESAPLQIEVPAEPLQSAQEVRKQFSPFTGKIKGKRVRLRAQPDLDSQVIKELNRNELVSVIGEQGDFWIVEPPAHLKAFVFRSFVLDGVVEGNRVNVRLAPTLESPIIGHLSQGDHVGRIVSSSNNKWLEITPPANSRFYVAKDYVSKEGGPELKMQIDKRRNAAQQLLETAALALATELHKPFEAIDIQRLSQPYTVVIKDYSDFTDLTEQAREGLVTLQEAYLQKKVDYMESRKIAFEEEDGLMLTSAVSAGEKTKGFSRLGEVTDKMRLWQTVEDAIYSSWARVNEGKDVRTYYEEQKTKSVMLTGILQAYADPVKNKPGDFLIRNKDLPIAYVYSTQVNLEDLVGKKVTVTGAPRPNNHFAFPAYFVLSVE